MSFAALRRWAGSLRFRLTVWNTAVVILLLIGALIAVRAGLRRNLLILLTEFVTEESVAAADDVVKLHRQPDLLHKQLNHRASGHPRRQLFIELFDDSGQLRWASMHTPKFTVADELPMNATGPFDHGHYRMVQQRLVLDDGPPLFLRVGCAISRAEIQLASMTETLLLIGGVLLLIIPVGGYLLAGRATRPLAEMIHTTRGLKPDSLTERLPVRATHDELDQLARTINGLLDRIARYLGQNREFTANVAHELRSPLAAMQFALELALNADRSTAEYKEFLASMLEECGELRTLVNQLLLLAEGDVGLLGTHREPVRLDETIRRSLDMFDVVAENAGVALTAPRLEPVVVRGDGQRLWQVVNNLIDNAINFTPTGGAVTVTLDCHDEQAVLTVADTGPGIAAVDLPHIFERFYQGDKSRHRDTGRRGTGLGLSICQSIVTAHGGTIRAESVPGAGTTFIVTLTGGVRSDADSQSTSTDRGDLAPDGPGTTSVRVS